MEENDLDKYYYDGEEVFLNDIANELIDDMMRVKTESKPFLNSDLTEILSINTGLYAPIKYNDMVDDILIEKTKEFVKMISAGRFEKGAKYFYGHKI